MMSLKSTRQERVTLKELGTPTQSAGLMPTSQTAANHVFTSTDVTPEERLEVQKLCADYDLTQCLQPPVTKDKLYRCFLMMEGVDPTLTSQPWFDNHYRWIVWKLSCMQRSYSKLYNHSLGPLQLLTQMKYRYEREVDHSQRSALKKIYEGDDLASKSMVLVVSSVRQLADGGSKAVYQLELSDGWYSIKATHDPAMNTLVDKGVVREGTKLMISRAQLCGLDQGCSPLSTKCDDVRLNISTNSVRRARYYARLGYSPYKPITSLGSLLPLGGAVSCMKIVVSRIYPIIYMEKSETGTVFRNEARERQEQRLEAVRNEKLMEQEVDKENRLHSKSEVTKRRHYSERDLRNVTTGQELLDLVESSIDPDFTQQLMTERQRERLVGYQQVVACEERAKIQAKVKESLPADRQVTPMLKVKVTSLHEADVSSGAWTVLTLWRPPHDMLSLFREGHAFNAYNLSVSEVRGQKVSSPVLLSANRRSMFENIPVRGELLDQVYTPRQLVAVDKLYDYITRNNIYTDIDTAAIVIAWESASSNLTVVFMADKDANMMSLNFWGGFKAYGYSDLIREGVLLHCQNLVRSKTPLRYTLPSLSVTELSIISTSSSRTFSGPQPNYLQELSALTQVERKELVKRCQVELVKLATSSRSYSYCTPPVADRSIGEGDTSHNVLDGSCGSYVPSVKARQRLQMLDKSIAMTEDLSAFPVVSTDVSTRRALTAQFQSPATCKNRTAASGEGTAKSADISCTPVAKQPPANHMKAVESDDEVSDSQMLACFSQT